MFHAGLVTMLTGSVLFLIAAFWPISRVFAERSAEKKLAIIMGEKGTWDVIQVLFGAGAFIVALGFAILAFYLRKLPYSNLLTITAVLLIAGSILWIWHLYLRAVDPASFAYGLQPKWHFIVYTLFTQIGIALAGYFLLQSPFQNWVGWMFLGGMGIIFLLTVIFRDMPPFVYYLFLVIAAIALWKKTHLADQFSTV